MVGIYINDFSITKFYEYLVLLKQYNIKSKNLRFYNPTIKDNKDIIIKGNLSLLIQDIITNKLSKVIIFSLDKIDNKDIKLLEETTTKYKIPLIIL